MSKELDKDQMVMCIKAIFETAIKENLEYTVREHLAMATAPIVNYNQSEPNSSTRKMSI
jgi:hypothetical protein